MSSYLCIPSTIDRYIVVEGRVLHFKISGSFEKELDVISVINYLGNKIEVDIASLLVNKNVDEVEILKYINGEYKLDVIPFHSISSIYSYLSDNSLFVGKRLISIDGLTADQYIFVCKKGVLK